MATRNLELVRGASVPRTHRPPAETLERNPGTTLDLDVVRGIRVNRSAVERRASTIPTRRTVKKQWQAAWLLRAITLMDLTTLSGDDTPERVRLLCDRARRPLAPELASRLGSIAPRLHAASLCVYHHFLPVAKPAPTRSTRSSTVRTC